MSHRGTLLDSLLLTARAALAVSLLLLPLVACGGGGDGGRPDIDLPPASMDSDMTGTAPDMTGTDPEMTGTAPDMAGGADPGDAAPGVPPTEPVPGDEPATSGHDAAGVVACGGFSVVVDGDNITGDPGPEAYVVDPVGCKTATDSCCVDGPNIGTDKGQGWDQGVQCFANTLDCPTGPTGEPTIRGSCDGPEDCAEGEWCCIDIGAQRVSCVAAQTCKDVRGLHICHTDDQCEGGESCANAGPLFPWWASCD